MIMRQSVRCYSGVVVTNEIGCWNNSNRRIAAPTLAAWTPTYWLVSCCQAVYFGQRPCLSIPMNFYLRQLVG